jgi:hypothetical protein
MTAPILHDVEIFAQAIHAHIFGGEAGCGERRTGRGRQNSGAVDLIDQDLRRPGIGYEQKCAGRVGEHHRLFVVHRRDAHRHGERQAADGCQDAERIHRPSIDLLQLRKNGVDIFLLGDNHSRTAEVDGDGGRSVVRGGTKSAFSGVESVAIDCAQFADVKREIRVVGIAATGGDASARGRAGGRAKCGAASIVSATGQPYHCQGRHQRQNHPDSYRHEIASAETSRAASRPAPAPFWIFVEPSKNSGTAGCAAVRSSLPTRRS